MNEAVRSGRAFASAGGASWSPRGAGGDGLSLSAAVDGTVFSAVSPVALAILRLPAVYLWPIVRAAMKKNQRVEGGPTLCTRSKAQVTVNSGGL